MKKKSRPGMVVWLVGLVLWFGVTPASADDVVVYTENYPPYNYLGNDGVVEGLATEKVHQVLEAAGLSYTIKLVPWARAMFYATTKKNTLIYTITRTPDREEEFDWLVPLAPSSFYLFVRADDPRSVSPETLLSGQFQAACVTGDLTCDLLGWTGIPKENIVVVANSRTEDFRMVVANRADIYVSDLAVNARLRRKEGFDPAITRPAMRIEGKAGFYLASGLGTDVTLRDKVRNTFLALEKTGRYQLVDTTAIQRTQDNN
ncbi:substrate-binding periplasmic protein [Kordiimonas sp.]|uniref:substrate-binding periplasmic protein n=1 Tax=Kordiimonas sp. TaxID=1970157 RepID=UPI003B51847B